MVAITFRNIGCKLNQAEIESMARELAGKGYKVVNFFKEADLCVINTCSVTSKAARDSRKMARRAKRENPNIKTVLTGCYVNYATLERVKGETEADLVVPNEEKNSVVARITQLFPLSSELYIGRGAVKLDLPLGHVRGALKIEDGCSMKCSFCVIPYLRGRYSSLPIEQVVSEAKFMEECGYSEIVITGTQISAYRWEKYRLFDVICKILETTSKVRIRISSIAPWQFDRRILTLMENEKRVCRHFHLSLQSGSDKILRAMRRPYTICRYLELVEEIKSRIPRVAITTDIIVGFPGEEDKDFLDSVKAVCKAKFSKVHVFPYSPRKGTAASAIKEQIPENIKKSRVKRIIEVASAYEEEFRNSNIGEKVEVVWEDVRNEQLIGTSDNYLRVVKSFGEISDVGKIEEVTISRNLGGVLFC